LIAVSPGHPARISGCSVSGLIHMAIGFAVFPSGLWE
jgi:hypothetical protein